MSIVRLKLLDKMFFWIIIYSLPLFGWNHSAISDDTKRQFVADKWVLAVQEMHKSGIPASVTLAQCILETNWGQSDLSYLANNYFGIKCKDYWVGPTYYKVDDDKDMSGQLVKSCFRQYDSMESSFRDHSNFLLISPNYKSLFDLGSQNYKGWCEGLKKCGYATDPYYDAKLIQIIETFNLSRFDAISHLNEYNILPLQDTIFSKQFILNVPSAYKLPPNYTRKIK